MAEPFLSEIRMMSFHFPPKGWALSNGQLLAIGQNQALFSLLGTTFGGDGRVNFALPDLRGRTPVHVGNGHTLGEQRGQNAHTLTVAEIPIHTHTVTAKAPPNGSSNVNNPSGNFLSNSAPAEIYANGAGAPGLLTLNASAIGTAGESQPHENRAPSLAISFCIALQGIFPSRN